MHQRRYGSNLLHLAAAQAAPGYATEVQRWLRLRLRRSKLVWLAAAKAALGEITSLLTGSACGSGGAGSGPLYLIWTAMGVSAAAKAAPDVMC